MATCPGFMNSRTGRSQVRTGFGTRTAKQEKIPRGAAVRESDEKKRSPGMYNPPSKALAMAARAGYPRFG